MAIGINLVNAIKICDVQNDAYKKVLIKADTDPKDGYIDESEMEAAAKDLYAIVKQPSNKAVTNSEQFLLKTLQVQSVSVLKVKSNEETPVMDYIDNIALSNKDNPLAGIYYSNRLTHSKLLALDKIKTTNSARIAEFVQSLSDTLKDDADVFKLAIYQGANVLQYASPRIQDNEEMVKLAMKHNSYGRKNSSEFQHASERIRSIADMVKFAIDIGGEALQYASEKCRDNKSFAISALKNVYLDEVASLFNSLSDKLQKDKDIAIVLALFASSVIKSKSTSPEIVALQNLSVKNFRTIVPDLISKGDIDTATLGLFKLGIESLSFRHGDDGRGGDRGYTYRYLTIFPHDKKPLSDYYELLPEPGRIIDLMQEYSPIKTGALFFDCALLIRLIKDDVILTDYNSNKREQGVKILINVLNLPDTIESLKNAFGMKHYRGDENPILGDEIVTDL